MSFMVLPPIVGRIAYVALLIAVLVTLLLLARVDKPEPAIFNDLAVASTAELADEAQAAADRMHKLVLERVRDEERLLAAARSDNEFGCVEFYDVRSPEQMADLRKEQERHPCIGKVALVAAVVDAESLDGVEGSLDVKDSPGSAASLVIMRGAVSHRYVMGLNDQLMPLDSAGGSTIVAAVTGELSEGEMQKAAEEAVARVDGTLEDGAWSEQEALAAAQQDERFDCAEYYNPQNQKETKTLREDSSAHPCPGQLGATVVVLEPQALGKKDAQLAERIESSEHGAASFVIVHPIVSMKPAAAISPFIQQG